MQQLITLLAGVGAASVNLLYNAWVLEEPDLFQTVFLPIMAAACLLLTILLPRGRRISRRDSITPKSASVSKLRISSSFSQF